MVRKRKKYPQVKLLPEKVISEDSGIYSSGGAYSFLNLLIHLIEKYYGREAAIWCSKVSEIDIDRFDQNQFVIFKGQKEKFGGSWNPRILCHSIRQRKPLREKKRSLQPSQ